MLFMHKVMGVEDNRFCAGGSGASTKSPPKLKEKPAAVQEKLMNDALPGDHGTRQRVFVASFCMHLFARGLRARTLYPSGCGAPRAEKKLRWH